MWPESLDAYTTDPEVVARVSLHSGGGWHPWAYSVVMPFRYARDFRRCSILRVFQITGALPAVIAKRRFGIPFVKRKVEHGTTDGYEFFTPGSWVVWVGHYPDRPSAESRLPAVARTAPGAYVTLVRPRQAGGAPTG